MRIQSTLCCNKNGLNMICLVLGLFFLLTMQAQAQRKGCGACMPDPTRTGGGVQHCLGPDLEYYSKACKYTPPGDPPSNTCFNPAPGIALFKDKNFRGTCRVFLPGVYPNVATAGFPNDEASSIRMGNSQGAYICSNRNQEGRCEFIENHIADLSDTRVGNDALSSLGVGRDGARPCGIYVNPPEVFQGVISGLGSRGPDCIVPANVQVLVRNDKILDFDETITSESMFGSGVTLDPRGSCSDFDATNSRGIFTEIRVNGRNVGQSIRIWPHTCAFYP